MRVRSRSAREDRQSVGPAYSFPDGLDVDPQQELADRPIVEVRPWIGAPWVGVFYGGSYSSPPAIPGRLVAWPDRQSFCVVYAGGGVVVRADDPKSTYEIDCFPITDLRIGMASELVLFADFTNLYADGPDGLLWHSRRLAADDLKISVIEGTTIHMWGFSGSSRREFTVDARTGEASGLPYDLGD